MSDTEAGTHAESANTAHSNPQSTPVSPVAHQVVDPHPANSAEAAAYNPGTADPGRAGGIMDAWRKTLETTGEVNYEEPNVTPKKAAAKAAAEVVEPEAPAETEPEAEPEVEAEPVDQKPAKLTQAESRELIAQRVKLNQRFQRREQQQAQRFAQIEQQLQSKASEFAPLHDCMKAIEAGDFDGIAKALGAAMKDPELTDWSKLNTAALQAVQSPVYKRMRQLERVQQERDAEAQRQREQYETSQRQAAQQAEIAAWKTNLAEELTTSDEPLFAEIIEKRPQMVDALFSIQQAHFDPVSGETLSAADAGAELLKNVRADFKFWSELFEKHSDSEILASLGATGKAPKAKAATVSDRGASLERQTAKKTSGATAQVAAPARKPSKNISQAQTSGPSAVAPMNSDQLKKFFARKMEEEWREAPPR